MMTLEKFWSEGETPAELEMATLLDELPQCAIVKTQAGIYKLFINAKVTKYSDPRELILSLKQGAGYE